MLNGSVKNSWKCFSNLQNVNIDEIIFSTAKEIIDGKFVQLHVQETEEISEIENYSDISSDLTAKKLNEFF